MSAVPYKVREARDTDFGFILDTWRRSFEGAPAVRDADSRHYVTEMAIAIGRMLRRNGALVRVACDAEDEDTLLGWAATNGHELHYTYVRGGEKERNMRGHGLVPAMLDGLEIRSYTFRTAKGEERLKPRLRGWVFTPRFSL